jgi:hypothetical protein
MLYAKIAPNGTVLQWPIEETALRRMFPNVALPKTITPEALAGLSVVMVFPSAIPPTLQETKTHRVQMSRTLTQVDGKWVRQYELVAVPPPQVEERANKRWVQVRARRAALMDEFEWRIARHQRQVRNGVTPTDNLAVLDAYMQALADITLQADPYQITWPQVPV